MHTQINARAVKRLTLAILLALSAYALANNMIGVTLNEIIDEFALSGAAQGLMGSMIGLGGMAALLFGPLLQGRAPKSLIILLSGILQILMLLLTGAAPDMPILLAACVLLGVGGAMLDNFTNSYMVDLHGGNSTRYLGYLHGFYGLGGLITPLLVTFLMARGNWRTAYFGAAAVFAALMVCFAAGARTGRGGASADARARENRVSLPMLKDYLASPRNLLILLAGGLYAASQMGVVGWVVRYMKLQFDAAELGSVSMSAFWVCATVSRFVAPHLPVKPIKLFPIGILLAAAAHAGGVFAASPVAMPVACALVGLLSGHSVPMLVGIAAEGNEGRTTLVTSAMLFSMALTRMLMPLLMGAVTTGVSAAAAMLLPAIAAALAGICGWLGGRVRAQKAELDLS